MQDSDTRPTRDVTTCSALSAALPEPLHGTAAVAGTWLCLEQRGPWGHTALLDSHLDADIGRALRDHGDSAGVRVQLIRRPGRHADTDDTARRVYLAHTHPAGNWMRTATIGEPAELLDLDLDLAARGVHDGWGHPTTEPVLLVCTNGRRDRCCAVHGRALIAELGGRHNEQIWETNHTGGHRFAPAAVLLPSGYTYGRLDAPDADAALSAAASGKVHLGHCRGRSTWTGPGQVAELALREHIGEYLTDALRVTLATEDAVDIAHLDGRRWHVTLRTRALPPHITSCGNTPKATRSSVADTITPMF